MPNKDGEWWNGGWQRRRKGEWDVELESSFRENDPGSVTLIEKSKGIWVDGEPSKSTGDNTTNFLPRIVEKSKVVDKPNNIKKDNQTNFLPRILEKSKVVDKPNNIKKDNQTNFLPKTVEKSEVVANLNKRKRDTITNSTSKTVNNSEDAIIKNFRCGDLMYGTSPGREKNYLKKLEVHHMVNIVKSSDGKNIVNQWARIGGTNGRSSRSMIINSYSDPVRSALSDEFARLRKYNGRGVFDLAKISPAISKAAIGRPPIYGFDFEGYQTVASTHSKLKISSKHVDEKLWWKRGSKSGIEMVAQQPDNVARRIHFILDGMDMGGVVNKDTRLHGDSITSSELRYIYRNWNRLKNKVIFYRDGKVVTSPWQAEETLWNNYHPKSKI